MTKIDIFSGFLGAGKTTLIKKLIQEAYQGEKVVLIENEFGEIGIDGGFLQEAGVNITEMNSGCICCSLVGDFSEALKKVAAEYSPDRILIEPSGVGKLSDVIKAVADAKLENAKLNAFCTVVDAKKCKMYIKNFGEFFLDQVKNASCIVLSHTATVSEDKLSQCVETLKELNENATLVTANWEELNGKAILAAMEKSESLATDLEKLEEELHHCHHGHHEHHHHDHDEECECGCHHHHDHHEHHHHDHDEECACGCHHHHDHHEHHHHDHDEECECGCHHHHDHHEHHHHADEVFTSWGKETTRKYSAEEIEKALAALANEEKFGTVLRAKGIVEGQDGWLHFDYVPGEPEVRNGAAGVTGRLCVIGCKLNEKALQELFMI